MIEYACRACTWADFTALSTLALDPPHPEEKFLLAVWLPRPPAVLKLLAMFQFFRNDCTSYQLKLTCGWI